MTRNVSYQNPIHAEENTPVVTILETKINDQQSFAIDSRGARYVIDLAKASFGGIVYPTQGSQWYLKKISSVWTLMARAPQQNPQLNPTLTPQPGDTFIGNEGTTNIMGNLKVAGLITTTVDPDIGTIKLHPSTSPPSGWLVCDGTAISRTTYSSLFGVIGTTFGVGDGSTTFNIPNLKGRFPVGRDAGQTEFDTMGETGGAKTATLTTTELPAHSHTVGTLVNAAEATHTHGAGSYVTGGTSASHTHVIGTDHDTSSGSFGYSAHNNSPSGAAFGFTTGGQSGDHTHNVTSGSSAAGSSHNHTISGSTASAGTGSAFSILPPYMALNFIIKAVSSFIPAVTGPGQTATSFNAIGSVPSDQGFTAAVNGDTSKRYIVHDDGKIEWGPGNNVPDISIARTGAGYLFTNATIQSEKAAVGNVAFVATVTGDTQSRINVFNGGTIQWGSGSIAQDTNLYRASADTLKTDDFFIAGAGLTVKADEIDTAGSASGTLLRHNGTKYVAVAEESNAQYPNVNYVSAIVGSNTTSTTFVDVPNITMSWTKNKTGTKVLFQAQWSWYNTNASGGYYWAFNINSTDYQFMQFIGTVLANSRLAGSGSFLLSGLAAGTYTVKLRYRVAGASQTLQMDSSDVACLSVMEVK